MYMCMSYLYIYCISKNTEWEEKIVLFMVQGTGDIVHVLSSKLNIYTASFCFYRTSKYMMLYIYLYIYIYIYM